MTSYQMTDDPASTISDITDALIDLEIPVYVGDVRADDAAVIYPESYDELMTQVFGIIKHCAVWAAVTTRVIVANGPHMLPVDQLWYQMDIVWADVAGTHRAEYYFIARQPVLLAVTCTKCGNIGGFGGHRCAINGAGWVIQDGAEYHFTLGMHRSHEATVFDSIHAAESAMRAVRDNVKGSRHWIADVISAVDAGLWDAQTHSVPGWKVSS